MVKEDSSGEPNEQRLDQKSCGSVWKWKIAIREITERNAVGIFQNVAEVPENRQPRILPHDDGGGAEEKE
jgi:hypothetical protein